MYILLAIPEVEDEKSVEKFECVRNIAGIVVEYKFWEVDVGVLDKALGAIKNWACLGVDTELMLSLDRGDPDICNHGSVVLPPNISLIYLTRSAYTSTFPRSLAAPTRSMSLPTVV